MSKDSWRMADIVAPEVRSRMMAGIRSKDTKPELLLRKALHKAGFRYRLHQRALPGTPDIVFSRWKAVLFIHGCFWHGHGCRLFRWPQTREEFWRQKIGRNIENDRRHLDQLTALGWRTGIVWECSTRDKAQWTTLLTQIEDWLRHDSGNREWEAA